MGSDRSKAKRDTHTDMPPSVSSAVTRDFPRSDLQQVNLEEAAEDAQWESDEEIREATGAVRTPTLKQQEPGSETVPFRPLNRPPLALLCVLDDGQEDGEWIRIRAGAFVIGRTEGDLVIPCDQMMSGRHAELSQTAEKGAYRWFLTDLWSTNGTYVRIQKASLKNGQHILLGSRQLRFETPEAQVEDPTSVPGRKAGGTRGWQQVSAAGAAPSLVELLPQGEGQRHHLTKPETWLGRDPRQCAIALPNDPMVSPRHARIVQDGKGRWMLENSRSLNGTWIRLVRTVINRTGQFQLGEQRFKIKIL